MTAAGHDVTQQLARVLSVLRPSLDIVAMRVQRGEPPAWCERRCWSDFLLGLSDGELSYSEEHGLLAHSSLALRMPSDLAPWLGELASAVRLPRLAAPAAPSLPWRGVRERKRAQLAAMLRAVAPLGRSAARIVDFGAGCGHFSRLAARAFEVEVLGLERSDERVAAARRNAAAESVARARFLRVDLSERAFALAADDLAFGLHACGELGDRLTLAAAGARCDAVLVSCCAQKISGGARVALSAAAQPLTLAREVLGLSNLSARAQGVETSLHQTLRARELRHALGVLLRERGVALAAGEEMQGFNRRQAHAPFAEIARRVLTLRGLTEPSPAELERAERVARAEFARVRRLSLPRNALARALELVVVLDRAQALIEAGLCVRVAEVFEAAVTPRNVALFASRSPARLPAVE